VKGFPVMNKKLKPVPNFKSEAKERAFWEIHDPSDYVDWSKAERVRFANFKPSAKSIFQRLSVDLLEQIKIASISKMCSTNP
jgi:hypothetical protein